MSTDRQFVAVKFSPSDTRSYTYHNDGERVALGDRVTVPTKRGQSSADVVDLPAEAPPFATKEIIGKARLI